MVPKSFPRLFLNVAILGLSVLSGAWPASLLRAGAPAGDTGWTAPINLSHSGSASNPQMVVDSSGRYHAVWLNAYDGYMVAESSDGKSWSNPVPVNFPFGVKDSAPLFVADGQGVIHAFWKDITNVLLYSRVTSDGFRNGLQWQAAARLADSVADYDAAADRLGTIHLAYVPAESTVTVGVAASLPLPAGVYYRDTSATGSKWTAARSLFQSPYLRALTSDQAHIRLAVSKDGARVSIVWDNRPLKRIVFARSGDGGKNWMDAVALKQPDGNLGSAAPYNGLLLETGQGLLFLWQTALQSGGCSFESQLSSDGGSTWSAPVEVMSRLSVCPQDNHLYLMTDQAAIVATTLGPQVVLAAWNGSQWSRPQAVLASFTDPETLNLVALSCQTVAVIGGTQLLTVGCDKAGGDIWLSARPLDAVADWFPPPTKWSAPSLLTETAGDISSVSLVADDQDHLSAFWVQNYLTGNVVTGTISTAKWDGKQWAPPVVVMVSNQSDIGQLALATSGQRLLMVWSEGSAGVIKFSWAYSGRTDIPTEWATPRALVPSGTAATTPHLMVGSSGVVLVTYAVAVNENRGIYLIRSTNAGASWSNAEKVFDAAAAGWNMVAAPWVLDSGSAWNAIWTRYPLPGSHGAFGLFAGQSQDGGQTWKTLPEVVDGRINWSTLLGGPGGYAHRLWQMSDASDRIVWHQFSDDAGNTWSQAASISGLDAYVGVPIAMLDTSGRLHLLQTKLNTGHSSEVKYWLWSSAGWTSQDSLSIGDSGGPVGYLASEITRSGQLFVVYPATAKDASSGKLLNALYYSSRLVDLKAITATPQAPLTPVGTPGLQSTRLPTAAATPATITPANNPTNGAGPQAVTTGNPWLGVFLGGSLVAAFVAGVFAFRLIAFRQR